MVPVWVVWSENSMNYDQGLQALRSHLPPEALAELATLADRLQVGLRDERLYGSTEQLRAERSRVIYALNELAYHYLNSSFSDLCQQPAAGAERDTVVSDLDVAIIIALQEEFRELYQDIAASVRTISEPSTGGVVYLFEHHSIA